jgi:hypothetical protein
VLERAGLISRGRSAQARPCRLEPERLDAAVDWIERHRRMWAERYDRLDRYVADLRHAPEPPTQPPEEPSHDERRRNR